MERQPHEVIQPEVRLANQLVDNLLIAIPIIRQQQYVPPEMLEYGRNIMSQVRLACEGQGWSMGRLMVKAIDVIDHVEAA